MHVHLYFAVLEFSTWVIIWSILTWSTQCSPSQEQGLGWVLDRWFWMMIIYGLQVSIRYIHASNGDLLWWLVLFLWLSAFTGFIIIMVLTWMGPLMYLCDGHIRCEYSFLVHLDILCPLLQLVFSFGQLQERYGSFKNFATDWPWGIKNRTQHNYWLDILGF